MGTGALLPLGTLIAAKTVTSILTSGTGTSTAGAPSPGIHGPWTPPQYSQSALTVLTSTSSSTTSSEASSTTSSVYVFDAVFKLAHHRVLKKTQHPVLTGANITDHAYIEPSRVVLEIGMSDAMASFTNGVWVGFSTKSISAWQILKQLQVNRTLLTLSTRLDTYYNMLIEEMSTSDTNQTRTALKASITFGEVLSAGVSSVATSSTRTQTTGSTSNGTISSTPPGQQQVNQNVLPSVLFPDAPTYPNVPGAGSVSSTTLSNSP